MGCRPPWYRAVRPPLWAVRGPFSGSGRKCIRPPSRAVLKALILRHFQRVLFLHISPVFPGPCAFAPFHPFCGTGGAIESVVPGRGKRPPALPAVPPSDRGRREQCGAQAGVQRKDGGAEPFAVDKHIPRRCPGAGSFRNHSCSTHAPTSGPFGTADRSCVGFRMRPFHTLPLQNPKSVRFAFLA